MLSHFFSPKTEGNFAGCFFKSRVSFIQHGWVSVSYIGDSRLELRHSNQKHRYCLHCTEFMLWCVTQHFQWNHVLTSKIRQTHSDIWVIFQLRCFFRSVPFYNTGRMASFHFQASLGKWLREGFPLKAINRTAVAKANPSERRPLIFYKCHL